MEIRKHMHTINVCHKYAIIKRNDYYVQQQNIYNSK